MPEPVCSAPLHQRPASVSAIYFQHLYFVWLFGWFPNNLMRIPFSFSPRTKKKMAHFPPTHPKPSKLFDCTSVCMAPEGALSTPCLYLNCSALGLAGQRQADAVTICPVHKDFSRRGLPQGLFILRAKVSAHSNLLSSQTPEVKPASSTFREWLKIALTSLPPLWLGLDWTQRENCP